MNTPEQYKQAACAAIDQAAARLIAFGEDIRLHPELGFREKRTSEKVLAEFQALGLQNITRPAHTGVKAYLPAAQGDVRVAVLGEMDAVLSPQHPDASAAGAAHACGHHAQLAGLLGAAIGLGAVAEHLQGGVCFIAAPAEEYVEIGYRSGLRRDGQLEYLGGKQQLIAEGAFDDVDLAMMVHAETDAPCPRAVIQGPAGGFIGKEVRFIGREAHAGGAPWQGINALNAASLAIQAIHAQRETFRDCDQVRVHPIITKGGDLVNTVPADVRMESYVRAASTQAMAQANAKVDRALRGAAYALGAKVEIDNLPGYLPLVQNQAMSQLFAENVRTLLPDVCIEKGLPFCGSTDMGDLSYLIPVIQPTMSGFSGGLHSKDFRVIAPYLAYVAPAKVLASTVIDLLTNGAASAKEILQNTVRHSVSEYKALWHSILTSPTDEEIPL